MIVEINNLRCRFGDKWVLNGIDLAVDSAEIVAIIGGSGCGKSTLLRHVMLLQKPSEGELHLFGERVDYHNTKMIEHCRQNMGVCFQHSALFSGLTVLDNVAFVLHEYTDLSPELIRQCALLKIRLSGLPIEAAEKRPCELSGGMLKRAALARALALDPKLLLLDEPTAGLDPHSSRAFDRLIQELKASLGLTVMLVTHDVESLVAADKIVYLLDGKVLTMGSYEQVRQHPHPQVQAYFAQTFQLTEEENGN